jgi:hypothetical protein
MLALGRVPTCATPRQIPPSKPPKRYDRARTPAPEKSWRNSPMIDPGPSRRQSPSTEGQNSRADSTVEILRSFCRLTADQTVSLWLRPPEAPCRHPALPMQRRCGRYLCSRFAAAENAWFGSRRPRIGLKRWTRQEARPPARRLRACAGRAPDCSQPENSGRLLERIFRSAFLGISGGCGKAEPARAAEVNIRACGNVNAPITLLIKGARPNLQPIRGFP